MIKKKEKKPIVLVDKAIESFEEDLIGVEYYVKSLNEAIKKGARVISVNSKYGGGKSSICNLLTKNSKYRKKSCISLWDVTMKVDNGDEELDVLSFYKSFLFQLSADFYNEKYSRYISNALNKSSGFINIFFKTIGVKVLFIFSCIFGALFYISKSIKTVKWNWINKVSEFLEMTFKISFIENLLLVLCLLFILLFLFKGRVVYNSWKSENNKNLSIDDVTSLYAGIVNDSIKIRSLLGKKNLIIIEDIDRCIKESNVKVVTNFITSIVKLLHYDCKNFWLKKKLNSIVLILCLDESSLKDKKEVQDEEMLLKLFDYRLDVGIIHNEDYYGIFDKLFDKKNISDDKKKSLGILLDSENNNIRLLKKEINDCFLKYYTLNERFNKKINKKNDKKENYINFNSCVAYSYLKNNFPNDFLELINDTKKSNVLTKAVEEYNVKKNIITNVLEELSLNRKFKNKIRDFIIKGYIDENYHLYFYNYPKYEQCRNIYEMHFWNFIKGNENLDVENNKKLSKKYVKKCVEDVNRVKMNYPKEILFDVYILGILLENKNDYQLLKLLEENLLLNSNDNIEFSIKFIQFLLDNNILYENIKFYLDTIKENKWRTYNILRNENIYDFRYLLTRFLEDNIIEYKYLFEGDFYSIFQREYQFLKVKDNIKHLINTLHFNDDLEDILIDIFDYLDINEKINFCRIWCKNIKTYNKFATFAIDTLFEYQNYEELILQKLFENVNYIKFNTKFCKYLNDIIAKTNRDTLLKLNMFNIDFGLTEESINKLIKNDIGRTPLLYWLNNDLFEKIESVDINLSERFNILLDAKFNYLEETIKKFKEYILYNSNCTKFDYLFVEQKYIDKYKIDIIWNAVKNIHLLVICNKNNSDIIVNNLKDKRVTFNKEEIVNLLNEVQKYITQQEYIKSNLLIELLNEYPQECLNISNENKLFEQFISNITYNTDYKYKLAINYQIICKKLLPAYYNSLRNYKNKEDKLLFADYINGLEKDNLTIELIKTINFPYNFNDNIINILNENNCNLEIIWTYFLRNELWKVNTNINKINSNEINELLNYDFKEKLLENYNFFRKVVDFGFIDKIDDDFIVKNIENESTISFELIKIYFEKINNVKKKEILSKINKINRLNCRLFIKLISKDSSLRDIIKNDRNIYINIYQALHPNYKAVFTRNFNVNINYQSA